MSKTLVCPHCGKSGKITTIDNQPLANYHDEELARKESYFLENEVYATARCWDCGHDFEIESGVSWRPSKTSDQTPEIIKKDYFVNYGLNGHNVNDLYQAAITVEYRKDAQPVVKMQSIMEAVHNLHNGMYGSNIFRASGSYNDVAIKVLTEI